MREIIADALILLGTFIITFGVVGILRAPTVYTRLHAASKSAFLGVVSLCLASIVTGDADVIARVAIIAILVLVTVPVASHAIAHGAYVDGKRREADSAAGRATPDEHEVDATPNIAG